MNHDQPYVYATTDKTEAIIYSVKGGNLNYTNIHGYDDDNKRCLIERKQNCLEEIYNTEGRYYIVDETNFKKHEELGVGENMGEIDLAFCLLLKHHPELEEKVIIKKDLLSKTNDEIFDNIK